MRTLLPLVVLLALLTGCSKGYGLLNKATAKVKKSVSVCTESISEKSAAEIKKACEEAASYKEEPVHATNGGTWDTKMLLW